MENELLDTNNQLVNTNNEILKMRYNHLGQIGFRLALFGVIVCASLLLGSVFTMFIVLIISLFGFVLPIITLGMPLAFNPHYFEDLSNLINNTTAVMDFFWSLSSYLKYVMLFSVIGSIIGSIFLLIDKNNRHWGKFVFCIISAVLCLLLFILIAAGAFGQGAGV